MAGVENVLGNYFAEAKKPKYKYEKGFVSEITFKVDPKDFKIDYKEPLKTDYTEVVALKHIYDVELVFKSKEKDGDDCWMTFEVKHRKVGEKEKLPKLKAEIKKKKKETEDEDEDTRSDDKEWYGKKEDDDEIDEEELDKKAKAKAAEKEAKKKK